MHTTRTRFLHADQLYTQCKIISRKIEDEWDDERFTGIQDYFNYMSSQIVQFIETTNTNNSYYVYIYSRDGSRIYVDTKENDHSQLGKEPEPDEKELYDKMINKDTLFTHHVINDQLYIISVARLSKRDYSILCFCKV